VGFFLAVKRLAGKTQLFKQCS